MQLDDNMLIKEHMQTYFPCLDKASAFGQGETDHPGEDQLDLVALEPEVELSYLVTDYVVPGYPTVLTTGETPDHDIPPNTDNVFYPDLSSTIPVRAVEIERTGPEDTDATEVESLTIGDTPTIAVDSPNTHLMSPNKNRSAERISDSLVSWALESGQPTSLWGTEPTGQSELTTTDHGLIRGTITELPSGTLDKNPPNLKETIVEAQQYEDGVVEQVVRPTVGENGETVRPTIRETTNNNKTQNEMENNADMIMEDETQMNVSDMLPMEIDEDMETGENMEVEANDENDVGRSRRSGRIIQRPIRYRERILTVHNKLMRTMIAPEGSPVEWRLAELAELIKFKKMEVFEVRPLPKGTKPIPMRWVYTHKKDDLKGAVYKARCVVQGFRQKEGTHYNKYKILSPVVELLAVRLLTIIATEKNYLIHHLDIQLASLNAPLPEGEEIFAIPPPGYKVPPATDGFSRSRYTE